MNDVLPQARAKQLIVQEMDHELVLFDSDRAQANVLNHTAAVIWKLCDGKTSVSDIAGRASRDLNAPIDSNLVWYTLEHLSRKNLLRAPLAPPANLKGMTRREFLRAGLVGTAVVLPVIVSMTAPRVSNAASCLAMGQPCMTSSECCSTMCVSGTCQ